MKEQSIGLVLIVLAFVLVVTATERGQDITTQTSGRDHERGSVAVNILRAINTAEYDYRYKHGGFVIWATLVKNEDLKLRGMEFAAQNEPKLGSVSLSEGPEILPGWMLRLNLTPDGKGYDVMLQDKTDKTCGYAALTDERAIIRQSKTIDCPI
jgi:hypothetical protein